MREPNVLESEITDPEAAARAELRRITEELESICQRLERVRAILPPPAVESLLLDEAEMDVATEIRSVIECVLSDSLRPAIRDLQAAAGYRSGSRSS